LPFKSAAYSITGSIGLLSDAAESFVNLAGGIMALAMLTIAHGPPMRITLTVTARPSIFSSASKAA